MEVVVYARWLGVLRVCRYVKTTVPCHDRQKLEQSLLIVEAVTTSPDALDC